MWKKNESEPAPQRPANPTPPSRPESRRELATIGASITVKGDLKGDEDLLIQGRVEGKIHFKQHNVTVGKSGRVKIRLNGHDATFSRPHRKNLQDSNEIAEIRKFLAGAGITLDEAGNSGKAPGN